MPALTDRAIASMRPVPGKRYEQFDDRVPGLAIRVAESGTKSWVLFYRTRVLDGAGAWVATREQVRWTLGRYPNTTLADARLKAKSALVGLETRGIDPRIEKRRARTGQTFADLAEHYIHEYAKKHKRTWQEDETTIDRELLPEWRHKKAAMVSRRDVRDVIEGIIDRGSPIRANRVLALISRIFNHGLEYDLVEQNPAARIRKQPETSRERELTESEMQELWGVLESASRIHRPAAEKPAISSMIALGLQLILVTAQRPGEVFTMERKDVDLAHGWWTIPAAKAKNGEAHLVPLTMTAIQTIAQALMQGPADSRWVFAGVPIGNVAARSKKAPSRLQSTGAISFSFHRHDLRRTAASGMGRAGVSRDHISRVLNHVDRGSRATVVYDRYDYSAEKLAALARWERSLAAVLRRSSTSSNKTGQTASGSSRKSA